MTGIDVIERTFIEVASLFRDSLYFATGCPVWSNRWNS